MESPDDVEGNAAVSVPVRRAIAESMELPRLAVKSMDGLAFRTLAPPRNRRSARICGGGVAVKGGGGGGNFHNSIAIEMDFLKIMLF
ncbi:hypothetical protein [Bradyrhizobium sp. STM 3562]|uniref:hypothetical protein n=1 Tax=Bradyrhizobium sp. STM 3562 TaxID=578924 RepID=UPI00388DE1B4